MYKLLLLLLPILLFSKFQVTTTLPFEAFIIKQIGQNHIRIKEILNLHTSKIRTFKKRELSYYANTRIYFNFGLNIENKYEEILLKENPKLIISDLSKNIKKLKYKGIENPYIWLDPILLREVVKNVYDSLVSVDHLNKEKYLINYNIFLDKLDKVYLETSKNLQNSENYNIFAYDEYFNYYAKRFKINIYRKEKKLQRTEEIKKMSRFIKLNKIKSILILDTDNVLIAKSIAGNSSINIKKHDIYNELIFLNIKQLTRQFTN
jgi:zinc transport system substrate-binding protein